MARFGNSPHTGMVHLNGNILCVVDVETTGLVPGIHDIWQIAVLPLDHRLEPSETAPPFYLNLRLKSPENIDKKALAVGRCDLAELQHSAIDPWKAVDMFDTWFNNLRLPVGKKIVPMGHNWLFDRQFIMEWLGGPVSFDSYFHFHYRCTMSIALGYNDRAEQLCERIPFPKVSQPYLGTIFKIPNLKAHDALQDCLQLAKIYKEMSKTFQPNLPGRVTPTLVTEE